MLKITAGKGFHITFENGYTVDTMTRKVEVEDDVYWVTVSTEPPPGGLRPDYVSNNIPDVASPTRDNTLKGMPYIDRHPNIHPETGEMK